MKLNFDRVHLINGTENRIEIFVWEINRKEDRRTGTVHYTNFIRLYEMSVKSLIQHLDLRVSRYGKTQSSEKSLRQTRLMINDENASDFPMDI